jgi:hypothetical protein
MVEAGRSRGPAVMTPSPIPEPGPRRHLLIAACGTDQQVAATLAATATAVATALGWPLQTLGDGDDPAEALTGLHRHGDPWLAALPIDPGKPLAAGDCWAETLAAWRQPVLLLITADQLVTGTAAGATALLRQMGVPLLGLLQVGGDWQAAPRRRDGLPWLGPIDDSASLALLIHRRLDQFEG